MKILEGFNPKVMFKGVDIWSILWLNLHFPLKVGIFRNFISKLGKILLESSLSIQNFHFGQVW